MREIKFRAWDKESNCWLPNFMIDENGIAEVYIDEDGGKEGLWEHALNKWKRIELSQYTGLKDKNGKEVFEGDIFPYEGRNLIVKYELGAVIGHWFGSNEYIFFDHYANDDEVEVIGNIKENPDLIGG